MVKNDQEETMSDDLRKLLDDTYGDDYDDYDYDYEAHEGGWAWASIVLTDPRNRYLLDAVIERANERCPEATTNGGQAAAGGE